MSPESQTWAQNKASAILAALVCSEDPLKPSIALLCKLGSIAVHVDEYLSDDGREIDWSVLQSLIDDPEVKQWTRDMGVYLPRKR